MCVQELSIDKANLDEVNALAMKLIAESHSGVHIIEDRRAALNAKLVFDINYGFNSCMCTLSPL